MCGPVGEWLELTLISRTFLTCVQVQFQLFVRLDRTRRRAGSVLPMIEPRLDSDSLIYVDGLKSDGSVVPVGIRAVRALLA